MRFMTVLIGVLALGMPGYALAHDHEHGDGHDGHEGCCCCRHGDEHHHQSAKTDAEKPAKAKADSDQKNVKSPPEKAAAPAQKQ